MAFRSIYTYLFILICFITIQGSFAQRTSKSIDITDVFDQMMEEHGEDHVVDITGFQIGFTNLPGGNMDAAHQYLTEKYPSKVDEDDRVQFLNHVSFSNCDFPGDLILRNMVLKNLEIKDSFIPNIDISNCYIGSLILEDNEIAYSIEATNSRMVSVNLSGNSVNYGILFEYDSLVNDFAVENNIVNEGELILNTIGSGGSVTIGNNFVTGVFIENSRFQLPEYGEFNNYKLPGAVSSDLYLINNSFRGDSTSMVYFNKGSYLNLDVRENKFFVNVYFVENNINERFFMVDNEFFSTVSFEKVLFSEIWNELYWTQFAGYKLRYADYGALTPEELEDDVQLKNLINIYKDLHTIFLERGDLESANACYSEMKQLQGKKLKRIYQSEGGFGNFFRWQLNRLLKLYTNHGTDPALAVVVSLYVIFAFAIFYLLFPSEWDKDSKNRLLVSYKKLLNRKGKSFFNSLLVIAGSILLSLINAVTLSINSFVTLGFGSIPTRGLARYLCIIEGFLGWFLLSIFTVAMINQVLA